MDRHVLPERCPNATVCIDAFHVVAWATQALDDVRREVWNEARKGGMTQHARALKDRAMPCGAIPRT